MIFCLIRIFSWQKGQLFLRQSPAPATMYSHSYVLSVAMAIRRFVELQMGRFFPVLLEISVRSRDVDPLITIPQIQRIRGKRNNRQGAAFINKKRLRYYSTWPLTGFESSGPYDCCRVDADGRMIIGKQQAIFDKSGRFAPIRRVVYSSPWRRTNDCHQQRSGMESSGIGEYRALHLSNNPF